MDDASSSQSRPTDREMYEVQAESTIKNLSPGGATSSDRVRKAVRKTKLILSTLGEMNKARSVPRRRSVLSGKVWRYILYGKKDSGSEAEHGEDHPRSDALCALLFILIMVTTITTVLYLQITSWPQATQSYYTDDPQDNRRGGLIYSCGCSLPPNLQSPENPPENTTNQRVCHDFSDLEEVTIFMFSDSNEGTRVSDIVRQSVKPITKHLEGFTMTQAFRELTVHNKSAYSSLISQKLGVKLQPVIYPSIDYLLSPNFNYYSTDYTHMSLFYDCTDCDLCSLEKANKLAEAIAAEGIAAEAIPPGIFANCYYYADLERCNTSSRNYTAKCVLYPSGESPAIFGIRGFLGQLLNLDGVTNIRGELNEYHNATAMQPDALFIQLREYSESSIPWNLVEAQKGSLLWTALLPLLATDCSYFPTIVQVCNHISVCRFLGEDCLDDNYCNLPEGLFSPENLPDKTQQTICNGRYPSGTCKMTSSLGHLRKEESSTRDALSKFLISKFSDAIVNNNTQYDGVCSKTYQNVIRYDPSGAVPTPQGEQQREQPDTMFLEAECTSPKPLTDANANTTNQPSASLFINTTVNTTKSQLPFCWTTGRFHSLSDFPEADWSQLPDDLYQANADRFVCYRVGPQKFVTWFINAFGILFGWIGTIQLIFYAAFAWLFVPARKRMYRRSIASRI